MKVLTLADVGKTIEIKKGRPFGVSLPAGGSTGYMWKVEEMDDNMLRKVGNQKLSPTSKAIGSANKVTFTFIAQNSGEGNLKLCYLRPWENEEPSRTFEVTIKVI